MKNIVALKSNDALLIDFLKTINNFDNFIVFSNWVIFENFSNINLSDFIHLIESDFNTNLKVIYSNLTNSKDLDLFQYFIKNENILDSKINCLSECILNNLVRNDENLIILLKEKFSLVPPHILNNIFELINNNLNVKLTSELNYLHRNTLNNHIQRFSEITLLNPIFVIDSFVIYYFKEYF